jgi:adenosylmethionine-8-amino-7-oxononanoate aminotransferase
VTEAVVAAARDRGILVYSGTGNANGVDGDMILLGPPFVVTDQELERIAAALAESIDVAAAATGDAALR